MGEMKPLRVLDPKEAAARLMAMRSKLPDFDTETFKTSRQADCRARSREAPWPRRQPTYTTPLPAVAWRVSDDGVQPPTLRRCIRRLRPEALNDHRTGAEGPRDMEMHERRIFAVLVAIYQLKRCRLVAMQEAARQLGVRMATIRHSLFRYATDEEMDYNPYAGGPGRLSLEEANRREQVLVEKIASTTNRTLNGALKAFADSCDLVFSHGLLANYWSPRIEDAIRTRWPNRYAGSMAYAASMR